jgi:hypothetical protein
MDQYSMLNYPRFPKLLIIEVCRICNKELKRKNEISLVRSEVLMEVTTYSSILWDMAPCSLLDICGPLFFQLFTAAWW